MVCRLRKTMIVMITVIMVIAEPLFTLGSAYADVGSISDGVDVQYDKNGGVLSSLGFDTSKMPEDYDPDKTTNPYGSDVSTLNEVKEIVILDTQNADPPTALAESRLYGHNKNLDGKWDTFAADPIKNSLDFLSEQSFVSAAKCDINGNGRDSALALVYTNYNYQDATSGSTDSKIYMRLYDPKTGIKSDPFEIATLNQNNKLSYSYMVQSQLQITAGDFDKDSVDEIAVYAPSGNGNDRSRVTVFDLMEGKDCENPYSNSSWRQSWNYILPVTKENVIVTGFQSLLPEFAQNVYNNIDLTAGDADNDGICDLIISYGASDTNYGKYYLTWQIGSAREIARSLPSKSVLLYGSDRGQMLKDQQPIEYDGEDLIRVSFAFGDVDGDGNEDMFMAGQKKSEQSNNYTRVIARYVYDREDEAMVIESMDDIKVVDGDWSDDGNGNKTFVSANGWDADYYSVPLMKANLAIGNIMGDQENTKIYLDSVLLSYDEGNYSIVDELEDTSTVKSGNNDVPKGSQVFTDLKEGITDNVGVQCDYYEYGADAGNFAGSYNDYVIVNRKTVKEFGTLHIRDAASILMLDESSDPKLINKQETSEPHDNLYGGSCYLITAPDTDVDSMIATYTGIHDIEYDKPKVLAVLASAPYFKDVADFDGGDMLNWCNTSYGSSSGNESGYKYTYSSHVGVYLNGAIGFKMLHAATETALGQARSETWGHSDTREFEISFNTAGGEDAVILFSTPKEKFKYELEGVMIDDNGKIRTCKQTLIVSDQHNPVTQTLTLEDYMDIQKKYDKDLPDVTKYLTSTPGDPSTYPSSENDISPEAKAALNKDGTETGDEFAGIAYGSGTITQSVTHSHSETEKGEDEENGVFWDSNIGVESDIESELSQFMVSAGIGVKFDFEWTEGATSAALSGIDFSGTVANMPKAAKGYGYDYDWKLFKYEIEFLNYTFPIVSYIVNDVTAPPRLPDLIEQDFDRTTDSELTLTWTYNYGDPQKFEIYRYEDFPQGGGDKLVGTVGGSDFRVVKDDDGNTMRDKNGNIIRQYYFTDSDLSADTKYQYRVKVTRIKVPNVSIFSPVIEGRTNVSEMPDVSLSTDNLTIYKDSTYKVKAILADPDKYQKDVNYLWQKYDEKKRKWEDVEDGDKQILYFYNCGKKNEGKYRCRINCIRKRESSPQYISVFTEVCNVRYSLRSVKFGDIKVYAGKGKSDTNTAISVTVENANKASTIRPTGTIVFTLDGPNGKILVSADIDEETGTATVPSIEDTLGTTGTDAFVNGGYLVTVYYQGTKIFYPADDPEEYHYLRNINECMFLSTYSTYCFNSDVAKTARLFDYRKDEGGKVTRTDLTDQLSILKFYAVDENGEKTGDAIETCDLSDGSGEARVPLDSRLIGSAYVEAYMKGSDEPAAGVKVETRRINLDLSLNEKLTGINNVSLMDVSDISCQESIDINEKNIRLGDDRKSIADLIGFRYYEQNGDFLFDSDHVDASQIIPASYSVDIYTPKKIGESDNPLPLYYNLTLTGARFMVVGNYYNVSAGPKDKSSGSVVMISPDDYVDFESKGYAGGTKLTLKAVPNKGYEIKHWIINECGENEYTLPGTEKIDYSIRSQNTTGNGNVIIQAVMKPKNNRITYAASGHGTVTVQPEIESGGTVLADTKLTFTAKPDDGWHFKEWRWASFGGSNIVSTGVMNEDGTNTKTFTMPDSSAELYGLFSRDTIDIAMSDGLDALYLNENFDQHYDNGVTVLTERGKDVPRGAEVTVRTKPGIMLVPGAQWTVSVITEEGIVPVTPTETMSAGREACTFTLPENAEACSVSVDTMQGRFTAAASADDVDFTLKIDGQLMSGSQVDSIVSGSQLDVEAKPSRGRILTAWIVNGERIEFSDTIYTCSVTDNLSISAETGADEEKNLKLKAEGGGTAKYVITDKNGEEHEDTFGADEKTVAIYKGESVFLTIADEDKEHTLTSIFLDGKYKDLDEGTLTIDSVDSDADILVRFGQNIYIDAAFHRNFRNDGSRLIDDDKAEISDGESIKVPKGGEIQFSVIVGNDYKCIVTQDGNEISPYESRPYSGSQTIYNFQVDAPDTDTEFYATDHETTYIYNTEDFNSWFGDLREKPYFGLSQPDGVLMADIDMTGVHNFVPPEFLEATLDGNGHTVSGWSFGSADRRMENYHGVFGDIREGAGLKNIVFDGLWVYAKIDVHGGLLAENNYGTLSGVTLQGGCLNVAHTGSMFESAGFAVTNYGKIEYCMVNGLTVVTDGSKAFAGVAGVVYNLTDDQGRAGSMIGNYIKHFRVQGVDGGPDLEESRILSNSLCDPAEAGMNFYNQNYYAKDKRGTSVYSITDKPDDMAEAEQEVNGTQFPKKLAHHMNKVLGGRYWGNSRETGDNGIYQLMRNETYYAPIQLDYIAGQTITRYEAPGSRAIPGRDLFGDDAPDAWEIGDKAYVPGTIINFQEDKTVNGVKDFSEYEACVIRDPDGQIPDTTYYKKLDDAIKALADSKGLKAQELQVIGDTVSSMDTINIDSLTMVTIKDGKALTIRKGTQINNSGMIMVEQGATVHKYGSLLNEGQVVIPEGSSFYNYGSSLNNMGMINDKANIICDPHVFGEWEFSDDPDESGNWTRTSTCTICGAEVTEEIEPDPPAVKVSSIAVLKEPDDTLYEIGEQFSDNGLKVYAVLTDGTRALINNYTLSLSVDGGDDEPLADGDVLGNDGDGKVTVKYDRFKCSFDIEIMNTAGLLTVAGPDGNEITEAELEPAMELKLTASLKRKLAFKTDITWESSDDSVIRLAAGTGKENDLTAVGPGKATVTVTVTDQNGKPVEAVDPRTVEISVISHITALDITDGDFTLEKDKTHGLTLAITPEDATDKVTWSSSNDKIVSVDENGVVKGVRGGKAIISAESPSGISDSCVVSVYEKVTDMTLEPEALALVTGRYGTVRADALNANANGEVLWTVDDPETCAFFVRNEETGEMEIVDTTSTKLSDDGVGTSDTYVVVAGLKEGTARITASAEGEDGAMIEKNCDITVSSGEDSVWITHNGARISGEQMTLSIDGRFIMLGAESTAESDTFKWDIIGDKDDPVLRVDDGGSVTLRKKGTAAVQVTSELTGATDICLIRVMIDLAEIRLSETETTMLKGTRHKLTAELLPEGSEGRLIWTSSDESVATVSEKGDVIAVGEGEAMITAAADAEDVAPAECRVTVVGDPVTVKLSREEADIRKGATIVITADVTPAGASGKLVWSSSDPDTATVSDSGVVTGVKAGNAMITAKFTGKWTGEASCCVTVYEPDLTVILNEESFIYDGKQKKPSVTVKSGDTVLAEDETDSNSEVIILYSNSWSKLPGTYKVTVLARKWYYGSGEASYKIGLKPTKLKKVIRKRRAFKAKWKKVRKPYITGYQIRWSRKKSMANSKTTYVRKWNVTRKLVRKLKGGKKYYVQVRTYVRKGGVSYYSAWSNKKAVKVKK